MVGIFFFASVGAVVISIAARNGSRSSGELSAQLTSKIGKLLQTIQTS